MKTELPGLIRRLVAARQDDFECLRAINDSTELGILPQNVHADCRVMLAGYVRNTDLLNDRPNNYIFASGLLAGRFGDRAGLDALTHLFHFASQPELKSVVFWNIVRYASVRSIPYGREIAALYFALLRVWPVERVKLDGLPPLDFDCIVLVTQFLTLQHAPTADAIDYARILRGLGYNPLIVNTNELPAQTGLPLVDALAANKRDDLNGMKTVEAGGQSYALFTPSAEMPSSEGLALAAALISAIGPRLCVCVGGFSLLQERIGEIAPAVIFPTTASLVPSRRCTSVLFNDLSVEDRLMMSDQGIESDSVLDGYRYSYRLPAVRSQTFERSHFDADTSSFMIAIVGYRLAAELDRDFRMLLSQILSQIPHAKFLFVGPLDFTIKQDLQGQFGNAAAFLPYADDLCGLYRICDVYLNPKRGGGGTSAALALASGLPAYSLDTGDVARILPRPFIFADEQSLVNGVVALAGSHDRARQRDLALQSWSAVSDRTRLVADVLHRMRKGVARGPLQ